VRTVVGLLLARGFTATERARADRGGDAPVASEAFLPVDPTGRRARDLRFAVRAATDDLLEERLYDRAPALWHVREVKMIDLRAVRLGWIRPHPGDRSRRIADS